MQMMIEMSRLAQEYGLQCWIWYPAMDPDYANPATVAGQLHRRGLLPRLAGWRVDFSGLADVARPQPALPLPQRTTLTGYWMAICHTARAVACSDDDTIRPDPPSRSTTPVPVVPTPRPE